MVALCRLVGPFLCKDLKTEVKNVIITLSESRKGQKSVFLLTDRRPKRLRGRVFVVGSG